MDNNPYKTIGTIIQLILGLLLTALSIIDKWRSLKLPVKTSALVGFAAIFFAGALYFQRRYFAHLFKKAPFISRLLAAFTVIAGSMVTAYYVLDYYHAFGTFTDLVHIGVLAAVCMVLLYVLERSQVEARIGVHYLGVFPENLHELIEKVENATHSIEVVSDVLSYGAFSAPRLHRQLINSLETMKNKHGHLEIVWCGYTLDQARVSVLQQLELAGIQQGSSEERKFLNGTKMKSFLTSYGGITAPNTIDEFLSIALNDMNLSVQKQLKKIGSRACCSINSPLPLYIFLIDRRIGIFSVPIAQSNFIREEVFFTQDPALLQMLARYGDLFWKECA